MRSFTLASLTLLAACGLHDGSRHSEEAPLVRTTAFVELSEIEGTHWVLRAEDGRIYLPHSGFPESFHVEGARVRVVLREREDLVSPAPGILVDVLEIAVASCAGVTCGAPPPALTVTVVPADVAGLTIEQQTLPPGSVAACEGRTCTFDGGAGVYAFVLGAPGYEPVRVHAVVPTWRAVPGICCASPYVPQELTIELTPR